MIDASIDDKVVSNRFSTSDGLDKSFLYPGGSRCGEAGWLSKTLLASSRKDNGGGHDRLHIVYKEV